jgi:heme exporter protein D
MNFDSFSAFIEMGGYGLYVWSAYSITLVVIVYNISRPILMRKQVIREQKRMQQHLPAGKEDLA